MKHIFFSIAIIALLFTACKKDISINETAAIDVKAFHDQNVGASAGDLLSDTTYRALVLEIQYMPGYKPAPATLDYVKKFLNTYLNKPGGIIIKLQEIRGNQNDTLNNVEVQEIENRSRTQFINKDTLAVYILFTDGMHPDNKILGRAYHNTSLVIYGKAIHENANLSGKLTRQELETTVLLHELGHLLGLVNKGSMLRSNHTDSDHQDHCQNKKCLMYYSAETQNHSSILLRGNIPALDSNCVADLVRNGGKACAVTGAVFKK